MNFKKLNSCVCCGSNELALIVDLGAQSPANNYSVKKKYPLKLNVCKVCTHLQLSHSVSPNILFNDYPYNSGVSATMLEYYNKFADIVMQYGEHKNILEIACNDGSQLNEFKKRGLDTYCIEPSKVHSKIIKKHGHKLSPTFFPDGISKKFDIIVAQNVFAHTPTPIDFLNGCKDRMHEKSLLFIQNSQINMLGDGQFDTIYHEHISFFNIKSMKMILSRTGMELLETLYMPGIHGDSMVYVIRYNEIDIEPYARFIIKMDTEINRLKRDIKSYMDDGYLFVAYGAAAKMINLLRAIKIKPDYIIDETPSKIGKIIPGLGRITGELPHLNKLVILPVWNFHDEISEKINEKMKSKEYKILKYFK